MGGSRKGVWMDIGWTWFETAIGYPGLDSAIKAIILVALRHGI
jgi:hypothetical protein